VSLEVRDNQRPRRERVHDGWHRELRRAPTVDGHDGDGTRVVVEHDAVGPESGEARVKRHLGRELIARLDGGGAEDRGAGCSDTGEDRKSNERVLHTTSSAAVAALVWSWR